MEIRLMDMSIQNFKGIRSLKIDLGGKDTVICGANATGKTSVYDAFLWLLFDKDSSMSSKFSVKPMDEHGEEVHNLTTSVSASLWIDGITHTLRRTLTENWVKPRGRAEAVFQGNVSAYEIDDVPRKAGEFAAFCAKLVDESTFRLITNPAAFNALKWQDRRKQLLRLSGAPEVINDAKFAPIIDQVRRMGAEDLKKQLLSQRRKHNAELDQIPARVDEVRAMMPQLNDQQIEDAECAAEDAERDIDRVRRQITDASGAAERIRSEIRELERSIRGVESRNRAASEHHWRQQEREDARRREAIINAQHGTEENRKGEVDARGHAENAEKECVALRAEWKKVQAEPFPNIDTICPACGQELPSDRLADLRRNAEEEWNARKKKRLDAIRADGKRLAALRDRMLAVADDCRKRAEECEARAQELQASERNALPMPELEVVDEQLRRRLDDLRRQAEMPEDTRAAALREQLQELVRLRDNCRAILADRDRCMQAEGRINELTARQQELGRQVMQLDQKLMLVDEYVQELCRRVEESVSARFPTVRWRLYERQINGGLVDTCTCMVNGVPYADANNAAKINAGLEIINVLSEHIGVQVPIFVDNAEAVNQVTVTRGQQIRLVVTNDPQLIVKKGM